MGGTLVYRFATNVASIGWVFRLPEGLPLEVTCPIRAFIRFGRAYLAEGWVIAPCRKSTKALPQLHIKFIYGLINSHSTYRKGETHRKKQLD